MIEYLYDAIRATSGQSVDIVARISNEDGTPITNSCGLMFHKDDKTVDHFDGKKLDDNGYWSFTIPGEYTSGLKGKYYYCICQGSNMLCFKTPFYLV
jgi:hypothetical protein